MKIGELSHRTGVPTRMLRYYEQQGLLESARLANGYRDYPDAAVGRVIEIRGLIASGLPTRLVRFVLGTVDDPELAETCSRNFAELLAAELRHIDDRITCLSRSRETVRAFLERTAHADLLGQPATPGRRSST